VRISSRTAASTAAASRGTGRAAAVSRAARLARLRLHRRRRAVL